MRGRQPVDDRRSDGDVQALQTRDDVARSGRGAPAKLDDFLHAVDSLRVLVPAVEHCVEEVVCLIDEAVVEQELRPREGGVRRGSLVGRRYRRETQSDSATPNTPGGTT